MSPCPPVSDEQARRNLDRKKNVMYARMTPFPSGISGLLGYYGAPTPRPGFKSRLLHDGNFVDADADVNSTASERSFSFAAAHR